MDAGFRVHAQLIRRSTDEHFWSESYDRELGDALTLESDVSQSIARKVEVAVTGEERARLVTARSVSPEVYESYLKGLAAKGNSRAEVEKQIAWFDEAIRKEPTFAPSYVGCKRNRRRNSSTGNVISFFWLPWAESRQRKVMLPCSRAISLRFRAGITLGQKSGEAEPPVVVYEGLRFARFQKDSP